MKMNWPFAASVILNLSLLGIVGAPLALRLAKSPAAPSAISTAASVAAQSAALRWGQIECMDLPTYVENLRTIGCPEDTIERIVTPRIEERFAEKRKEIEAGPSDESVPGNSAALTQLRQQQTAYAVALFKAPAGGGASPSAPTAPQTNTITGQASLPAPSSSSSTTASSSNTGSTDPATGAPVSANVALASANSSRNATPASNAPSQVTTPLALVDPPTALSESQQSNLNLLRKDFVNSLGNQDPNDPSYLARWQSAQQLSDEKFLLDFGSQALASQQAARVQQEGLPFAKFKQPQ